MGQKDREREKLEWNMNMPIIGVIMLSFKWIRTKSKWLHSLSIPFFFRKMVWVQQFEHKTNVRKNSKVVKWMKCQAVVMNESKWSVSFHKSFALRWHECLCDSQSLLYYVKKTGFHEPNRVPRFTLNFGFYLLPFYHWKNFQLICIIIELSR